MPKTLETSENSKKDYLKTHYYKGFENNIKESIKQIIADTNMKLVSVNDDYGEIFATSLNYDVTFKVFQYSMTEVSVDLFIESRFLFDFTKTKKVIEDFYSRLSKKHEFLGLGLHKEKSN